MKTIKMFIVFILLIVIIYFSFHLIKKAKKEEIKEEKLENYFIVYFTLNNPIVVSNDKTLKSTIQVGDKISKWALIITDKNSMVGLTDPERRIRIMIGKESTLLIEDIEKIKVELKTGKTYNYIDKKTEFYQKTPTITIGVRGTKFIVGVDKEKSYIKVAKGEVAVERNIKIPDNIEKEIEILKEDELISVTKKENEKIEKEIGINILKLPKLTREKVLKDDKEIIELNNYDNIKPQINTGKLIIEENKLTVYINNIKIGEGNIEVILNEGDYKIKIEDENLIYEEKIKIEKDKTKVIKPVFRNKTKEEKLKPIEPKKRPIIEK